MKVKGSQNALSALIRTRLRQPYAKSQVESGFAPKPIALSAALSNHISTTVSAAFVEYLCATTGLACGAERASSILTDQGLNPAAKVGSTPLQEIASGAKRAGCLITANGELCAAAKIEGKKFGLGSVFDDETGNLTTGIRSGTSVATAAEIVTLVNQGVHSMKAVKADPVSPKNNESWFNTVDRCMRIHVGGQTLSSQPFDT